MLTVQDKTSLTHFGFEEDTKDLYSKFIKNAEYYVESKENKLNLFLQFVLLDENENVIVDEKHDVPNIDEAIRWFSSLENQNSI